MRSVRRVRPLQNWARSCRFLEEEGVKRTVPLRHMPGARREEGAKPSWKTWGRVGKARTLTRCTRVPTFRIWKLA